MNFIRMSVAALLLCLAFACNSSSTSERAVADNTTAAPITNNEQKQETPPGDQQQDPQGPGKVPQPQTDWDKKIIKNANLNIEVKDYDAYNQQVHNNIKQWGGYVAQEEQQSSEFRKENVIDIKVPVEQFDNIVNALTSGKENVIVKKITSQDVTGQVVDTRARMEAKRQVRERYMDLLKQAKNMEDILRVQNVINDIQVEIEAASGSINYLTHAAAYSTIQLTFFQVLKAGEPETKEPAFGTRVLDSLKNGLMWIGELLLLLLNLWPLALLGVIVFWGFKKWRSSRLKTGN